MSHELTLQEINQFRSDFDNSRNQVVSRAAMRSGVLEASFNPAVTNRLNDVFSVEVETDNVTNQMQSGRCWLFATLNTLRHDFGKNIRLRTSPYLKHITSSGIRLNVLIFSMMQLLILQISP